MGHQSLFELRASCLPGRCSTTWVTLPGCFYLPDLHFFKYVLIVQGGFTLVFHTSMIHTSIRLTLSIAYSSLIALLPYYSTTYSAFHYTVFIHRYISTEILIMFFDFVPFIEKVNYTSTSTNLYFHKVGHIFRKKLKLGEI
jgi:hypothetical protein